ncbi:hypothetical protein ACFOWM_12275 [Ferruginibacter yonginensis]|uniref:Uncharacterized protein n=1 Tax=Ferruginibacter yonginensis TaxID=1310416 RepID=A0ABV8QVB1_9BACT
MNVYNYIDKNKTRELHYSYTEFNSIIENAGYKQEKNGFLHLFFDWSVIKHWSFEYELYNENQLTSYFKNTDPVVKIQTL